jgi:hypothetical protein
MTRIESVDWKSSASRVVLLGFGWTLALGALGSTLAGALMGMPVLFLAGAIIGFTAWTVSKMVPEPIPVAIEAPRRRRSISRRFSGHRLPG